MTGRVVKRCNGKGSIFMEDAGYRFFWNRLLHRTCKGLVILFNRDNVSKILALHDNYCDSTLSNPIYTTLKRPIKSFNLW